MNIKVTKSGTPTYLFNITQIIFGKMHVNDPNGGWDSQGHSIDCVWIYNEANPEGFGVIGAAAISEVKQKLEALESEFLVVEADIG